MSEKLKKIIIIILFILIVIGLIFLLYLVFFKKPVYIEPTPPISIEEIEEERIRLPVSYEEWQRMSVQQRVEQELPAREWKEEIALPVEMVIPERIAPEINNIAQGDRTWITPLSEQSVKGASLAADGTNSVYYDSVSGQFYSVDTVGNKELLTEQIFYNLDKINWSPTKDKAILEYPDGFKIMYDFNKKRQYTLPKNWQDFSWNTTGTQIAFKSMSQYSENTWLAIASPDGTQAKPIEHMGDNADKVTVSWSPNNQVIAFSATGAPRGTWEQEMLLIGQHQENFRSLIIDGRGFEPKWSPQGDKVIYSVYSAQSGYLPRLYMVGAQGDKIGKDKEDLGLTTWAHKCTFSQNGETIYCAVPIDLPEGAGLVQELGDDSRDEFYKIDTLTGSVSFLAEGAMGGYNVQEMYLSNDETYLYFVDKSTQKLRYLRLK